MASSTEHPVIRFLTFVGSGGAWALVPAVIPTAYQPAGFAVCLLVAVGSVTWPYLRRAKSLFKQHVAWRFALTPPAGQVAPTSTTRQLPETAAPSNDDQPPVPVVEPVFTDEVRAMFPYAYPKAVLKAAIERAHGTLEAREAGKPYRLTIVFAMLNDHGQTMLDCSAVLLGYQHEGRWHPVDLPFGTRAAPFAIPHTQPKRLAFLTRDISDPITPEPFLLCLNGKRIPLADNSTYDLLIELRSKYPIPTVVTVRVVTGEKLNATAEITNMELAKFDPAVLAG